MNKVYKKRKKLVDLVKNKKVYEPSEAIKILKENSYVNFNETIDISINLGIDSNKTEQNVKGVMNLPNGNGKDVTVTVVTNDEKQSEAKDNGASTVGGKELIDTFLKGKIDFDILIASPDMMPFLGKVAKILGPKGLMPNPKLGTVTNDITKSVKDFKSGLIEIRNDKDGNLASTIGRRSFPTEKLIENYKFFIDSIKKEKPDTIKGDFIKNIFLTSTMGISYKVGAK